MKAFQNKHNISAFFCKRLDIHLRIDLGRAVWGGDVIPLRLAKGGDMYARIF